MIQKLGLFCTINFRKFITINLIRRTNQQIKFFSDSFPFAKNSYAHYFGRLFLIVSVAITYSAAVMMYLSIIITSCMYFESQIDDLIDSFNYIDATLSEKTSIIIADAQKEFIELIEYQISSAE